VSRPRDGRFDLNLLGGAGASVGDTLVWDGIRWKPGAPSFSATDTTAMHYAGVWTAIPAYSENDVVTRSGGLYIALLDMAPNNDPLTPPSVGATVISNTGSLTATSSSTWRYQPFIPTSTQTVGGITVYFNGANAAQTATVGIVSSSPGASPTYLSSAVVSLPANTSTFEVLLPAQVSLVSGTTYYLEVETPSGAVLMLSGFSNTTYGCTLPGNTISNGGSAGPLEFLLGDGVKYWDQLA
jgi:hypothetical protein